MGPMAYAMIPGLFLPLSISMLGGGFWIETLETLHNCSSNAVLQACNLFAVNAVQAYTTFTEGHDACILESIMLNLQRFQRFGIVFFYGM